MSKFLRVINLLKPTISKVLKQLNDAENAETRDRFKEPGIDYLDSYNFLPSDMRNLNIQTPSCRDDFVQHIIKPQNQRMSQNNSDTVELFPSNHSEIIFKHYRHNVQSSRTIHIKTIQIKTALRSSLSQGPTPDRQAV